ncbi:MAG: UDP-N-acetylmuramate--L-alanine ligase [Proteobacteria bacterium]|nr:UDP-N-acetylmuramate--L-alanine ligase [Pseudomonadota bacterium]
MSYLTPDNKFVNRMKHIHMIGIGGSGMSGIAEVLHNLGFQVSGSDIQQGDVTNRLAKMGIKVIIGHHIENIQTANVVVISSAIQDENPELLAAREQNKAILSRAEMLAELMRFKIGIAVAGTHGKTTTTSLLACVLAAGNLDPTFVIGGLLNSAGTNAALGSSQYLVAEADESDGSFLLLQPILAIVTNIDADHMQTYNGKFSLLKEAFENFLHHLPFYGVAVLCIDDENVAELAQRLVRPTITYGLSELAMIRATNIKHQKQNMSFDVVQEGKVIANQVIINLPGLHNVQNALAAIAIAIELDVSIDNIKTGLQQFEGIGRRFNLTQNLQCKAGTFTLVDDYAHHPTELKAAINACRGGWNNRLVVVFQPHRFSRTRDLFDEFTEALNHADVLVITDVYAAGEEPISGFSSGDLSRSIRARGKIDPIYIGEIKHLPNDLNAILQDEDLVLFAGAGSIGQVVKSIVENKGVEFNND